MRTVNKFIFTGLFFVLAVCAFAQAQDSIVHADTTVITAQDVTVVPPDSLKAADSLQVMTDTVPPKKTKVYLIHSNTLSFDKAVKPDAQILNGDVCFRHDSSYMYCDSAYFFEQTNSLEAFSNVRMEQETPCSSTEIIFFMTETRRWLICARMSGWRTGR